MSTNNLNGAKRHFSYCINIPYKRIIKKEGKINENHAK